MMMRKFLLLGLLAVFGSLCANAKIDYQGKLRIEVVDEVSGLPIPGFQFSVSEDYHSKVIATAESGMDGIGWTKKKLKPGKYYIYNSRTAGGYAPYEGAGPYDFPEAGTGMVFKVKGGNKDCKIDQAESDSILKMSGVVTDETLKRIADDTEHRIFISCKGSIFSDYFCLIPKGSDAYLKASDISLNFKRKKTTLTFKIGPTYANKYFNLGTYSEGAQFVENLLVNNTFSGKKSNIYNQDNAPFNNSTVSFYHGWIAHPDMYGGQSFNLTDKGSQYSCNAASIVEGAKVAMKFSLSKKNHKFKLTLKSACNIGCYFKFTKKD